MDKTNILRRLREDNEDLPTLVDKMNDPDRNKNGEFTLSVADIYRFRGVAQFLTDADVDGFRENIAEYAKLEIGAFDGFIAGEPIDPSHFSMFTYKDLLDILASGDMGLARSFASRMGGRPEVEKAFDRDFEIAIGYALKAILAGDDAAARARIDDLEVACRHPDYLNFTGYMRVLRAIVDADTASLEAGFVELLAGHKHESKGSGMFASTVDERLCVWGIGLANLARARGLPVRIDDPLLPAELIV